MVRHSYQSFATWPQVELPTAVERVREFIRRRVLGKAEPVGVTGDDVRAGFHFILGRECDAEGAESRAKAHPSLSHLRLDLLKSAEFKRLLLNLEL